MSYQTVIIHKQLKMLREGEEDEEDEEKDGRTRKWAHTR